MVGSPACGGFRMSHDEIEALRALYAGHGHAPAAHGINVDQLRAQLPELGESLAAQLAELERDFTRERAHRLLCNLDGVATYVRRLVAGSEA
jgi:hypothetical protein